MGNCLTALMTSAGGASESSFYSQTHSKQERNECPCDGPEQTTSASSLAQPSATMQPFGGAWAIFDSPMPCQLS